LECRIGMPCWNAHNGTMSSAFVYFCLGSILAREYVVHDCIYDDMACVYQTYKWKCTAETDLYTVQLLLTQSLCSAAFSRDSGAYSLPKVNPSYYSLSCAQKVGKSNSAQGHVLLRSANLPGYGPALTQSPQFSSLHIALPVWSYRTSE